MRELGKQYYFTVTATTRSRRPTERDGVDYIFLTPETFRGMVDRGEFMEWAEVYGNLYGVPRAQVVDALTLGRDVIVKPDVQGAATIKKLAPEAVFIFLGPPSMEELGERLRQRMSESPDALAVRLKTAESEMREATEFDHVVINRQGRLDEAIEEIEEIAARERRRTPARKVIL